MKFSEVMRNARTLADSIGLVGAIVDNYDGQLIIGNTVVAYYSVYDRYTEEKAGM
jgi:hypothetical protein